MKKFFKNYIRGDYHCDTCPYCWEERGYEDCDAGCYIFGDLRDTCRLLPPFRHIIGYFRKKKALYYYAHEYDGFGEWYEQEEKKMKKYNELVGKLLKPYDLCWKDEKGNYHAIDKEYLIHQEVWRIKIGFDDYCNPFEVKTLRMEWQDLIKKTWGRFIGRFKPYFCE